MPGPAFRISIAAAALAIAAAELQAADLVPGVNTVGSYSWQGPYVGVNLGYQWGRVSNNSTDPSGVAGGLQAGYNVQRGQFVYGIEGDIQASAADDRFAPWKFSNPWFGTFRGRGGYAVGNMLFYGTVGLSYGRLTGENVLTGMRQSTTDIGWTAGAGVEVAFMRNWSAKAEYLYVDLGERTYSLTGTRNGLDSSLLRFGVNYRF
jgi:outer membrane immunogenic protein